MREADRIYFGLCGRKQDRVAASRLYEQLVKTNKEADAMYKVTNVPFIQPFSISVVLYIPESGRFVRISK